MLKFYCFRFGSPISVGIYGHPAYEASTFTLEVLKLSDSDVTSYVTITDEVLETGMLENKFKQYHDTNGKNAELKPNNKKKMKKMSNKLSGIFSLLEVFQLIFL